MAGWGWVVEISGRGAGYAHPLEKSAADFRDTSIHRLVSQHMNLWGLRLSSAQKMILIAVAVTLGR
jgi:hypothetical protein